MLQLTRYMSSALEKDKQNNPIFIGSDALFIAEAMAGPMCRLPISTIRNAYADDAEAMYQLRRPLNFQL